MSRGPSLLVATGNAGKLREYADLLRETPFTLLSLKDVGITDEVEETGDTFAENAWLKASGYAAMSGLLTLADDSGLEVDALGGDPGVHSARYGGRCLPFRRRPSGAAAAKSGRRTLAKTHGPVPVHHQHSPSPTVFRRGGRTPRLGSGLGGRSDTI